VAKKIEVQIVGDASSLQRALGQATSGTSKFGSALGTLAKTGALAAGAAGIGAVAVTLRQGIAEYTEASKVAAQTNAVIKSTGQIANVTAKDVDRLATSMMKKTGVDDEAIATGENMILTFKNIRNEAGRGNDIFNQATKAVLDMDTAMTQGNVTAESMAKTSIRVGKALNDPIAGITALSRVGVQFTKDQKEQIKAMVESGDVMGAQKLILKELTSEFGGSAEAIGKTMPKQLNVLKESFNNFAGDLVAKAIPSVQRFVDFLNTRLIPAEGFTATLKVAWEGLSEVAVDLWGQLETAVMGETRMVRIPTEKAIEFVEVEGLWAKLKTKMSEAVAAIDWSDVLIAVGVGIAKGVIRLQQEIWQFLFTAWKTAWSLLLSTAASAATELAGAVTGGMSNLRSAVTTTVLNAMRAGWTAISGAVGSFASAAVAVGSAVISAIRDRLEGLPGAVREKVSAAAGAVRGLVGAFASAAASIGSGIASGILAGVSGLGSRLISSLTSQISGAMSSVKGFFGIRSPSRMWAEEVGIPIAEGITVGAASFLKDNLAPNLNKQIGDAMNSNTLIKGADTAGGSIATTLKGGMDDYLEEKLPANFAEVIKAAVGSMPDFTSADLGMGGWEAALAPMVPTPRSMSPDGATTLGGGNTFIFEAPIGSEQDLQNMVVSALSKVTARGGLT
jgi:hypothetical protein